ncbi:MAG: amidohydrolase family protein [Aigarchaeota archaeon]|nr:amidohydrolase family protein [Aigarchaeota archaeon]
MTRILIKGGLVATMNPQRRVIEDGAVAVDGERIVDIGLTKDIEAKHNADILVEAQGKIVLPGIVCAHTHLYGALLRGAPLKIKPPGDFIQALHRVWWPCDEALTERDAYASALAAGVDMVTTGTTCFADTFSGPNYIHGSLSAIARAIEEIGMRGVLAFEATERNRPEEGARGLDENERFIKEVKEKGSKLTQGMYSLHASFTLSDEIIVEARKRATRDGAYMTIHTSEGLVDLYHNLERYGKRTVERLKDLGVLGRDMVLAHCVHLDEVELNIVAEKGCGVAHNPMSNMLNAVGVAPVPEMLKRKITVGIGNDGYIFDGFENMRSAYLLHKLQRRDPRVMTPPEILEMATINGAKLYGLDGEIGSIEKGKQADIIVVSSDSIPTPLTSETVAGHVVNSVRGADVETVLVAGRVIMDHRVLKTVDRETANSVAREAASALWDRMKRTQ